MPFVLITIACRNDKSGEALTLGLASCALVNVTLNAPGEDHECVKRISCNRFSRLL